MVGRVRQLELITMVGRVQWLDGTKARPVRWLDGYKLDCMSGSAFVTVKTPYQSRDPRKEVAQ
jgi:hypothetical protein